MFCTIVFGVLLVFLPTPVVTSVLPTFQSEPFSTDHNKDEFVFIPGTEQDVSTLVNNRYTCGEVSIVTNVTNRNVTFNFTFDTSTVNSSVVDYQCQIDFGDGQNQTVLWSNTTFVYEVCPYVPPSSTIVSVSPSVSAFSILATPALPPSTTVAFPGISATASIGTFATTPPASPNSILATPALPPSTTVAFPGISVTAPITPFAVTPPAMIAATPLVSVSPSMSSLPAVTTPPLLCPRAEKTDPLRVEHQYASPGLYVPDFTCSRPSVDIPCPVPKTDCKYEGDQIFDSSLKDIAHPLQTDVTEYLELTVNLTLVGDCEDESPSPDFKWRLYRIVNGETFPYMTFNTSLERKTFRPQSLQPGLYIVLVEVSVHANYSLIEDHMYLSVLSQELVPIITGGAVMTSSAYNRVTVDASGSYDPVTNADVISQPIITQWTLVKANTTYEEANKCVIRFPDCDLMNYTGAVIVTHHIAKHQYDVEISKHAVSPDDVVFVVFTMSRDSRISSAIQAILYGARDMIQATITCLYNCMPSRTSKMTKDRLELEVETTHQSHYRYSYNWTVSKWSPTHDSLTVEQTKVDSRYPSLVVPASSLVEGETYLVTVRVSNLDTGGLGIVSYARTINYLPTGGTCAIDITSGTATYDEFTVQCSGWLDEGESLDQSDANAETLLTYVVVQATAGDFVLEEILALSRKANLAFKVKVGDIANSYQTSINVQVIDMFGDAAVTRHVIQASPAFDFSTVSADNFGSGVVFDFMEEVRKILNYKLRKRDYIGAVTVASTAASQLSHIPVPSSDLAIPLTLDTENGVLLDLNYGDLEANSSFAGVGYTEVFNATFPASLDPATVTIRESFEYLATIVTDLVLKLIYDQGQGENQKLVTRLAQALTNMLIVEDYASNFTKETVARGLSLIGAASEQAWNSPSANIQDRDKEVAENGLLDLSSVTVDVVVPDSLDQRRFVGTMDESRQQIGDILSLLGDNATLAVEESSLSPNERAHLFLKQQTLINAEIEMAKEAAETSANSVLGVVRAILNSTKLCQACEKTFGTGMYTQKLVKKTARDLSNTDLVQTDSAVRIHSLDDLGNKTVTASLTRFNKNIFMYDNDGRSSVLTSGVVQIQLDEEVTSSSQNEVTVDMDVSVSDFLTIEPVIDEEDASQFSIHKFIYRSDVDDVCVFIRPFSNVIKSYDVYVSLSKAPTILTYDAMVTVSNASDWKTCISASIMNGRTGLLYLGVKGEQQAVASSSRKRRKRSTSSPTPPYNFTLITAACLNWEQNSRAWNNDKCRLEWLLEQSKIRCHCLNVRELTFGNSFYKAPNAIDFSSVFLKFSPLNQAAVIAMLAVLLCLYILLVVWARREDRRDLLRWGVTPLVGNQDGDGYLYLVSVYTGLRIGSGTESRVSFCLKGSKRDTDVRLLYDGARKKFATGSVNHFLMAVPGDLGHVTRLRIWHDNTGKGNMASWFLGKIVIKDVQTLDSFAFLCERWISVEDAEDSMECVMNDADVDKQLSFSRRFSSQAKHGLADSHVWASIVYRPYFSNFTRVQRVSCAFVYIMINMVANAMYFNPQDNYETQSAVQIGPLRFSVQQVYVSLICALITTPSTILVVLIFKLSVRKVPSSVTPSQIPDNDGEPARKCCSGCCKGRRDAMWDNLENCLVMYGQPVQGRVRLPFWMAYIGWLITVAGVVAPAFFVLTYSMEWGKQKSEEWLTTFLISMVQASFFLDPITVVFFAFCLAVVFKTSNADHPREYYTTLAKNYRKRIADHGDPLSEEEFPDPPIEKDALVEARGKREAELRWRRMVLNLFINGLFLAALIAISISNRDDRAYYLHRDIVNKLDLSGNRSVFTKMHTTAEFYSWLNEIVIPELFMDLDDDGNLLSWQLRNHVSGFSSYRVGPPRLRQLRSKEETCNIPYFDPQQCYPALETDNQETSWFCLGWVEGPCSPEDPYNFQSTEAWKYKTSEELNGISTSGQVAEYNGGGYIAKLDINKNISIELLEELYSNVWVDRQTRAVLLEFTVFCANVNMFVYSMFMVEFPASGATVTSYKVLPLRLYQHIGSIGNFVLICEIFCLLYFAGLLVVIVYGIIINGCASYKQFWLLLDILRLVTAVGAVALYYIRYATSKSTLEQFQSDMNAFVDFHHIAHYDELFVVFLSCLMFMSIVRVLRVVEGSWHVQVIARVFSRASGDLVGCAIVLLYIFVGFAVLGHLLFGPFLYNYKDIFHSISTLFTALVGNTRFTEINETDPVLAKLFFTCFVGLISLLMLSIFVSTLCASIDVLSKEYKNSQKHSEVFKRAKKVAEYFLAFVNPPRRTAKVYPDTDEMKSTVWPSRSSIMGSRRSIWPSRSSIGRSQSSIVRSQSSIGRSQSSIGLSQSSIGRSQCSIGRSQSCIGQSQISFTEVKPLEIECEVHAPAMEEGAPSATDDQAPEV